MSKFRICIDNPSNKKDKVYRYLIEYQGIIEYVENELPEKYSNIKMLDLEEKSLLSSFVDTHQYMDSFSTFHLGLNVMDARDNKEIASMIEPYLDGTHGVLFYEDKKVIDFCKKANRVGL